VAPSIVDDELVVVLFAARVLLVVLVVELRLVTVDVEGAVETPVELLGTVVATVVETELTVVEVELATALVDP
jgi:hypothetical protein